MTFNLPRLTSRLPLSAGAVIIASLLFSSCDSTIYEYEGDCSSHYYVKFVYDYNMLNADAFSGNVKSVALYAFDPDTHVLLGQWHTSTPDMEAPGWALEVDVTPGKTYDFLAWCGLYSTPASFSVPQGTIGVTTRSELTCTMLQQPQGYVEFDYPLAPLWHGELNGVTFSEEEAAVQTETIRLTKDTNSVLVALQNLSGDPMQEGLFEFTISDNNGLLSADNIPFDYNPVVRYLPYHTSLGTAAYDPSVIHSDGSSIDGQALQADAGGSLCVSIAEFSVNRIMADSNALLQVRRTDTGTLLFSIPLADVALMIKGYHNRQMSNQEFLDRQDSYNMTFFLDDNMRWAEAVIMINSWRIVYQSHTFE